MDATAPVGELIAAQRRRRGMSQAVLAGLLGRSESWLSQVERGVRPLDRISVLVEVARALEVRPADLVPGAFPPGDPATEHPAALQLRLALSGHEVLKAMYREPTQEQPDPLPADEVEAEVAGCWELAHASAYVELGEVLPTLISSLELTAGRQGEDGTRHAFRQLAEVYQVTAAAMSQLNETEVAWIAADRAVVAAERAGAPRLALAGEFRLAHVFLHAEYLAQAERTVDIALLAMRPPDFESDPELLSLWGAFSLVGAVVSTRQSDPDMAYGYLDSAEAAAERLGEDRNDFHTEFGPTNVALHAVTVAVELGDAGLALRRARTIDAAGLSAERRARLLMDIARAHGQRRQADQAVAALEEAERLAPEQVRTHQSVNALLRDLLRGERRRPNPALRHLARRVGVLR